jgi:hypothetical protein
MKELVLDIETSPNIGDIWGLFNQNVSLSQLRESTRMICFAAKWRGEDEVMFWSEFHHGPEEMVAAAYSLLDEADVAVHFNGTSFDIKHMKREILLGIGVPPSPFQEVDLLRVVKSNFRFASNKLDHVASQLGLGHKQSHEGHSLWVKCMAGDTQAWSNMRAYNKQDVILTEQLYDKLAPWISSPPNRNLYDATEGNCPACGSEALQRRGFTYTAVSKFQRFRCMDCGSWSKSGKSEARTELRGTG